MKFTLTRAGFQKEVFEEYPAIVENFKTEKKHIEEPMVDLWGRSFIYKQDTSYIKISTLNDLLKLREITNEDLVIVKDGRDETSYRIIIYDDYLE